MTDLALTASESSRLSLLEDKIVAGLKSFVEVGQSLMEIREQRLYRSSYPTFEEYCDERWGMSRVHAHRLIEASEVVAVLPIGNTPTNEAQARELVPLLRKCTPEVVRQVYAEVLDEAGDPIKVTAAARPSCRERWGMSHRMVETAIAALPVLVRRNDVSLAISTAASIATLPDPLQDAILDETTKRDEVRVLARESRRILDVETCRAGAASRSYTSTSLTEFLGWDEPDDRELLGCS